MNREQILLTLARGWDMTTLAVWRNASFKCEYCGKSLIENSDEYYYDSHIDHILPNADNSQSNLALSCKACNFIKRAHDSRLEEASNTREALIQRSANYIQKTRERNDARRTEDLRLLRLLSQLEDGNT